MGGIFGALGQIGEAQALGEQQRRKEEMEKAYLAVQQQYAASNKERVGQSQQELDLAKQREARLGKTARQPAYLGHILAPDGSLLYGVQGLDGNISFTKLPYSVDVAGEMKALDAGIGVLDPAVQPFAKAAVAPYVQANDYRGARNALKPYLETSGKGQIQKPAMETDTDFYFWADDPAHPGGPQVLNKVNKKSVRGPVDQGVAPSGTPLASSTGFTRPKPAPGEEVHMVAGTHKTPPAQKAAAKTLKPEVMAGLNALKVALYGNPIQKQKGLIDTLDIFDNPNSLRKLQVAWGLTRPEDAKSLAGRLGMIAMSEILNDQEREFMRQMTRAIGDINALRSVTGMPRSTQALMERYAMELPNPFLAKNKREAISQIGLVQRQIEAALADEPSMAMPQDDDSVVKNFLKSRGIQ